MSEPAPSPTVRISWAPIVRDLRPGAFGFVMATGIVSIAASELGPAWLSRVLLVVACVGTGVLGALLVARCVRFPSNLAAAIRAPERAFEFFSVVAGCNVLAERLDLAGHPLAAASLAAVAAAIWLVLTYAVPAVVVFCRKERSSLQAVNGGWLLWVVGTQSIAILAASLVSTWRSEGAFLSTCAVALWAIGVSLYFVLVAVIVVRWLTIPVDPAALGAANWILMGACAISVLAGARLLALPSSLAARTASAGLIEGLSFGLWSFGSWWIPLLVVFGWWRHVVRRFPLAYESALWSIVFPLGMYSASTGSFGAVAHLAFMRPTARVMLWVAVVAWGLVSVAAIVAAARRVTRVGGEPSPPVVGGTTVDHSV